MVRIACLGENPEIAMWLRVSRGRRADQGVMFTRVAYMHALICWGVNKEAAAGIVSRFVRVAEVTGLIKTYNRAAKVWNLQSPSLTDRRPDELEWRATARQFQEGRQVWVSIANPHGLASYGVRLVEDFRIYVVKEGVFRDMDRAAG